MVLGQEDRKAGERTVVKINDVEYAFRWCPAGTFKMGEDKEQHSVTLSNGFWMLETEVRTCPQIIFQFIFLLVL